MSVLLIGSEGSMGKRYQCILKYLKKDFWCVDKDDEQQAIYSLAEKAEGIIIASPTETHVKYLDQLSGLGVPILCEKPLSKDIEDLEFIKRTMSNPKVNLTMTMQYKMLDEKYSSGHTYYDYFRHGNDGIHWDCIQLIGLARGTVEIGESSPIWKCALNGKTLSLADMDKAYVEFVKSWFVKPGDDINEIIEMHHKTMRFKGGALGGKTG